MHVYPSFPEFHRCQNCYYKLKSYSYKSITFKYFPSSHSDITKDWTVRVITIDESCWHLKNKPIKTVWSSGLTGGHDHGLNMETEMDWNIQWSDLCDYLNNYKFRFRILCFHMFRFVGNESYINHCQHFWSKLLMTCLSLQISVHSFLFNFLSDITRE